MNRRFRLAGVLRAREVQEQVARGALAQANREVSSAHTEVTRRTQLLAAQPAPTSGPSPQFLAALTARRGLADQIAAAAHELAVVEREAAGRTQEWTAAAVRRRALEHLADRHAAAVRAADERAAQREIDDLATTASAREANR